MYPIAKIEEKQLAALRRLGLSEEEIAEVLESDRKIDKGEKLFSLTAEQEKASKQARQADRKPTIYKLDNTNGKHSKKADNDKAYLMQLIESAITAETKDFEMINSERECIFSFNDRKFKITLSAPRK